MSLSNTSSSESSSSDDDLPLSALKKSTIPPSSATSRRRSVTSYKEPSDNESEESEENEFQSKDELEEDSGSGSGSDEDSDEEDDKPIATLKSPVKAKTKAKPKKKTTATKKKATKTKTKKKKLSPSNSFSSSTTYALQTASSELYAKSKKGKLISELLFRWWYAISWPDASIIDTVPKNCDKFDGFPGVFVVTKGDEVGKIIDKRDQSTSPCFRNMALKSSEELKELLLKAIEEQRKMLIEHEGEGTQTEQDLKGLEKWASKVNAKTADKEAEKVLKAANIKLS
jgi:hypothetical protein